MSVRVSVILGRKGSDVVTIEPQATVAQAVSLLAEHNLGALVVAAEGSALDGIVSERDVVRELAASGAEVLTWTVERVMTTDVLTCEPESSTDTVMQVMTEHRARHLPVVEDGRLVGIVSIGDVVKSRIDELEMQAQSMEDYIGGVR